MCFDGAAQKGLALHQAEGLRCRGTRVILAREVGQTRSQGLLYRAIPHVDGY